MISISGWNEQPKKMSKNNIKSVPGHTEKSATKFPYYGYHVSSQNVTQKKMHISFLLLFLRVSVQNELSVNAFPLPALHISIFSNKTPMFHVQLDEPLYLDNWRSNGQRC
jgi:hypothetical protein